MFGEARHAFVLLLLSVSVLVPGKAWGQARPGRLIITVQDATGGILPNSPVTIVGIEDVTKARVVAPVRTTDRGVATFENLTLGRYSITAEFPGFDNGILRDIRVRAGDNRQTITLALGKMTDSVTVGQDRQESASDRAGTFGTALTREQMDALSDDPAEMRSQLLAMAGGDATIRVDSFEGQQLPPKSQIKSVRISRDQFSAENHFAGGLSIEIVTQPGVGPLRGGAGMRFYDSALDGKNPLVQQREPRQTRSMNLNVSGSLLKQKSSFSLFLNGGDSFTTPVTYRATPAGREFVLASTKTPSKNYSFSGSLDYAISRDHVLRSGFGRSGSTSSNQGMGGFNQPERGYSSDSRFTSFRVQDVGPVGRRFVTNTRFSMTLNNSSSRANFEAPTIIINDFQTTGGAQQAGGTRTRTFSLASDLDYVRGRHSVRTGVLIDGTFYRTDRTNNYLGTYTFESEAAFKAGTPRSYTKQIGDPVITYSNIQTGFYILDDIRMSRTFTLTPGLRYEGQTHLSDWVNFGPRFGVTWAPFKSGKTSLRGSWGIFQDWLSNATYEQTLRIDGFRQRSVNIANPTYPDPGVITSAAPVDKYLLGSDLRMPRTTRLSASMQQTITSKMSAGVSYTYSRGTDLFSGENLNAPVDGARPDAAFANIIRATSAGRSRAHTVGTNVSLNLSSPATASDQRQVNWRRGLSVYAGYTLGESLSDSGGPFSTPSTGNLADDWGPAAGDVRHRMNIGINTGFLKNFNASLSFNGSTAPPLNITTGRDDNGDLIFNDRPAGVGRNSERTAGQWNSYGYFSYSFSLGRKQMNTGGGVQITSVGGALSASPMGMQTVARYRLNINVTVQNLTNHANYIGYSGVQTSPLFMKPTAPSGVRQITIATNVSF